MSDQKYTPSRRWVDRSWGQFSRLIKERLAEGMRAYGNRSFSKDPVESLGELEEELLDVCGWAFVLHERLKTAEYAFRATAERPRSEPRAIETRAELPGSVDDPGLNLRLEGHEIVMLDALAARMRCSRSDVLRQALHLLFRVTFADKFAADGSVPLVTRGTPATKSLPGHRG